MAPLHFPPGFTWGTATAAHQIEGANVHSDGWALEYLPDRAGGFREPSGDAIDSYHRYGEDIGLIAGLGLNAYRFSVEWARIEPEPGVISVAALDHYKRVAEACREAGLSPMVTLHHFTSPLWLALAGGWNAPDAGKRFADYAARVARHIGPLAQWWCTINELNIVEMFANAGSEAGRRARFTARGRAALAKQFGSENAERFSSLFFNQGEMGARMREGHQLAVKALRAETKAPIGLTIAMQDIQALRGGEDQAAAARAKTQDQYLDVAGADDFVGVQTYSRELYDENGRARPLEGAELTQMGYEFYPEALGATVRHAASRTGKPILVTENGIGTDDDARRIAYTQTALEGLHAVMQDGVDVRGYFHWSAFDNFEWSLGYEKTFGLIAVDRTTFKRTPKPSASFYGTIAKANQIQSA